MKKLQVGGHKPRKESKDETNNMPAQISFNKNLLEFVSNFSNTTKRGHWVSRYDVESDSFSLTVSRLSNDARIRYLNNEIALYLTKNNKIEGIFIEYFKKNYVEHHSNMRLVLKDLRANKMKNKFIIELSSKKRDLITPKLQESLNIYLAKNLRIKQSKSLII